ncbi:hypothetical protein NpPPO83_00008965, partial [Neofusicoccum parvum]
MSASQCAGTFTSGARCPNAPMSGSRFCKHHQNQATDAARHGPSPGHRPTSRAPPAAGQACGA